ncbi:DUF421 domain-containing protein [Lewinella sp. 4G2]|uniref:DUF421 domain-containing protein n=1 Tax=Lewinella sp. 4G2 TaxID=1803372 RepID=UPI0007B471EF|nr:YetF domain-containing protein [Lewinella sp. 4G2]OAV43781.1 hypothetical protein A3850_004390 [Lewinella sp. 4G2]
MENWLISSPATLLITVVSVLIIMSVLLVSIRLFGLRSLAKMSSVDFASTIAIGSILASTMMNTDSSLLKGTVAILATLGFQQVFSKLKRDSDAIEAIAENSPKYLMIGTEIIKENLEASGVTHADLMAKLREANVLRFSEIKYVVFETTGDVSVLHGSQDVTVEEEILKDVVR